MTSRPRNERGQPRLQRVTVGERQAGGQVSAWLEDRIPGVAPRVGVNAAHIGGISVSISAEDARRLAYGLLAMTGTEPSERGRR